jgi:hypothetical protein
VPAARIKLLTNYDVAADRGERRASEFVCYESKG